MKKFIFCIILSIFYQCSQKQEIYAPVGNNQLNNINKNESVDRTKKLNEYERGEIKKWIAQQNEKFFEMPLNYWVNIENLNTRAEKPLDETFSYQYEVYDFAQRKLAIKGYHDVKFKKFPSEIMAVENTLKYLKKDELVTILVPSVLAFGTAGDDEKIEHDLPIIVKLKIIK